MTTANVSQTGTDSAIEAELTERYTRFFKLLTLAESEYAQGDFAAAAALAQLSARYAYPGNVGLFGSTRIEQLLVRIGETIATEEPEPIDAAAPGSRNVLHVLSYARPIGGDSRSALRWIQQDTRNRHFVAVTSQSDLQRSQAVPEELIDAAERSGGFVRVITGPTSKPLEQAGELRKLARAMDVAVLHLYPYDIVPLLALSTCQRPATLFVNHSDHTFWIGGSAAHCIVHLRSQSRDFLVQRRGLNPAMAGTVGIPMCPPRSLPDRCAAKASLGYAPETVVILTIATPFKYSSPGQVSFLELVDPVIQKNPNTVLIAVGPDPADRRWGAASSRTGGRIVARGVRWDNDLLYAAADIYADSVPFSSITSLLESGSHGLPLIGYRLPEPQLALLGPGAPGLDGALLVAHDPASYRGLLQRLITDEEFRHRSGSLVQRQVLSMHTGDSWRETVQALYEQAEKIASRGCLSGAEQKFRAASLNVALHRLYPPMNFRALTTHYLRDLPYRSRAAMALKLHRIGFPAGSLMLLLPASADRVVRQAARRLKNLRVNGSSQGPTGTERC